MPKEHWVSQQFSSFSLLVSSCLVPFLQNRLTYTVSNFSPFSKVPPVIRNWKMERLYNMTILCILRYRCNRTRNLPPCEKSKLKLCGCQPVARSLKLIDDDAKKLQKINQKPDRRGSGDIDHKPYDRWNRTAHTQLQSNITVTVSSPSREQYVQL